MMSNLDNGKSEYIERWLKEFSKEHPYSSWSVNFEYPNEGNHSIFYFNLSKNNDYQCRIFSTGEFDSSSVHSLTNDELFELKSLATLLGFNDGSFNAVENEGTSNNQAEAEYDSYQFEKNNTDQDETMATPDYYKQNNGKDLFEFCREGLLTPEEYRGFLKGSKLKYMLRYDYKGQKKSDLYKMLHYTQELVNFELGDEADV